MYIASWCGWDPIKEALREHVRAPTEREGLDGHDHRITAADTHAAILQNLLVEAHGLTATAEWDEWDKSHSSDARYRRW